MPGPQTYDVTIGETTLAVHEWAGDGNPILMLHATGFHARCWDQVIRHLPDCHIYAVDLPFHGKSEAKGEVDWQNMSIDIRELVEVLDLNLITGVGHSIGGHIVTRVAASLPQRFRHLVLVDPVIMSPQRYRAAAEARAGYTAAHHPVSRRKNQWRDAQEMFERFVDRSPFDTWDPAVLRDYCDHALREPGANGVRELACDPLHEAGIYMSSAATDAIYDELPLMMTPTTLLRANPGEGELPDMSNSPTWPELAEVIPHCEEIYLPDMNHFIPMQDPSLVARYVRAAR